MVSNLEGLWVILLIFFSFLIKNFNNTKWASSAVFNISSEFHLTHSIKISTINLLSLTSETKILGLFTSYSALISFLWGSDGKEFACNAGDSSWISGWGSSPGEGNGYPLQYPYLYNLTNRGVLTGNSPKGCKESDRTEVTKCAAVLWNIWF